MSLHEKKSYRLLCLVLCLAATIFFVGCRYQTDFGAAKAELGRLDTGAWNPSRDGPLNLDGEWEVCWGALVKPENFDACRKEGQPEYCMIPGSWNQHIAPGKKRGGDGAATFRLVVQTPKRPQRLSLRLGTIQSAYTVFINGLEVKSVGRPGVNRDSAIPSYRPLLVPAQPIHDRLEIVIQVSNFHHATGGIIRSLTLGNASILNSAKITREYGEIFMLGIIIIIGLYHITLFAFYRRDPAPVYFGLFCLILGLRTATTGQRYMERLFPELGWELFLKVEYLTFYISIPVFALYTYSLFPREFSRKAIKVIIGFSILFSLTVLATSGSFFTSMVNVFQLFTVLAGSYIIWVFFAAARNNREQARIFLLGFVFLFLAALNDILFAAQIIQTGYLVHFGLMAFIFFQAYMLSLRMARALSTVENQAGELLDINESLRNEISEKMVLQNDLIESHKRIKGIRTATILGLAKLAEYRDEDTGKHLERIREYCRVLADALRQRPGFKNYITAEYIEDLFQSAILHDIGKVGIPDAILLKQGKLTNEEFDVIKHHTLIGGDAIKTVEAQVEGQSFLTLGREIAYYHHEKWDGSGYPKGLSGDSIPLSARIAAVADVYDALTSVRPYKKAYPHEKAVEIITNSNGAHFDPDVVRAFMETEQSFIEIKLRLNED